MPEAKKPTQSPQPELALVENLHAPEFYADEATHFAVRGGNVSVTFCSYRWDNSIPGGVLRRVVTARLVMPAQSGHALAAGLFDFLKKQGMKMSEGPAN
jgi:hypothetical protein